MPLRLNKELEDRIQSHISVGAYASADELVAEALDLFEANRDALAVELRRRRDDLDSGRVKPLVGSRVLARLNRRIGRYQLRA